MQNKVVLAIDFGTKRIGLAIARFALAEPLMIIQNQKDEGKNQKVIEKIKKICVDENVVKIVVGISENEMAEKTEEFAKELKKHIDLPIEFFDETLSSQEVEKMIRTSGMKKSKRSAGIDHYAAARILQNYLDYN